VQPASTNCQWNFKYGFSKPTPSRSGLEVLVASANRSLEFLKLQYDEGLIDQRVCLSKILDLFKSGSHEQTCFTLALTTIFIREFARSRALMNRFILTCLSKLELITSHQDLSPVVESQHQCLVSLVRYAFISSPDSFVSPKLWPKFQKLREELLCLNNPAAQGLNIENQIIYKNFLNIEARNKRLVSKKEATSLKIVLKVVASHARKSNALVRQQTLNLTYHNAKHL
jgi:hypothetical protein